MRLVRISLPDDKLHDLHVIITKNKLLNIFL